MASRAEKQRLWRLKKLEREGRQPRAYWLMIVQAHLGIPRRRKYPYVSHHHQLEKQETVIPIERNVAMRAVLSTTRLTFLRRRK